MVCIRHVNKCKGKKCYIINGKNIGIIGAGINRKRRSRRKSGSIKHKRNRLTSKSYKKRVYRHSRKRRRGGRSYKKSTLIGELNNFLSSGYNTFIAPAATTMFGFLTLEGGVLKTITNPFRNIRSTIKLLLYIFLFMILYCKFSGRGCYEVDNIKTILKDLYEKLRTGRRENAPYITNKLQDIRVFIMGLFNKAKTKGSEIFGNVKKMFSSSVDEEVAEEGINELNEEEVRVETAAERGDITPDELTLLRADLARQQAELAQRAAELANLRQENAQLAEKNSQSELEQVFAIQQSQQISDGQIASLTSDLKQARENLRITTANAEQAREREIAANKKAAEATAKAAAEAEAKATETARLLEIARNEGRQAKQVEIEELISQLREQQQQAAAAAQEAQEAQAKLVQRSKEELKSATEAKEKAEAEVEHANKSLREAQESSINSAKQIEILNSNLTEARRRAEAAEARALAAEQEKRQALGKIERIRLVEQERINQEEAARRVVTVIERPASKEIDLSDCHNNLSRMKGTKFDITEITKRLTTLKEYDYNSSTKPLTIKHRAQNASRLNVNEISTYFTGLKEISECSQANYDKINKLYEIYQQIILVNDSYENINGIGRVYGRARGLITSIDKWEGPSDKIIIREGIDRFKMVKCNSNNDHLFGPYNATYDETYNNKAVFGSSEDPNSIANVIRIMTQVRYNAMYMSYGLSGSGKTHTLIGNSYRSITGESGIAQLSLEKLITEFGASRIEMKAVQVYKGKIYNCIGPVKPAIYKISNIPTENGKSGIKYIENPVIPKFNLELTPINIGKYLKSISEYITDVETARQLSQQGMVRCAGVRCTSTTTQFAPSFDYKNFNTKMTNFSQTGVKAQKSILTTEILSKIMSEPQTALGKINYMRNLLLLESVSKERFEDLNEAYFANASIDPSEVFDQEGVNIKTVSDFNTNITDIMQRRFTRTTMNNDDSSRSHLFVTINFYLKDANKPITLAIADLAGSEDPFEFLGDASIEGYYVVDSLGQLKQIMESYNAAKKPSEILASPPTKHGFNPRVEWAAQKTSIDNKFASSAMWNVMNKILNFDNIDKPDAVFTKVMTFINTKTYVPQNDSVLSTKICEETADSLVYGMDLTKIKQRGFGRVQKRIKRRTSRKRAKTQKLVKSKKSRKRRQSKKRTSRRRSRR